MEDIKVVFSNERVINIRDVYKFRMLNISDVTDNNFIERDVGATPDFVI